MDSHLAPGVVVLNKRYFSRDPLVTAKVGASSFTFSVLRVLLDNDILSGIVLYCRDEQLATPRCEVEEDWNGAAIVTTYFNFKMDKSQITTGLQKAFRLASGKKPKPSHPIVYYQTDTLLHYHPEGYRFCVTHHGPFAAHFAQEYSLDLARLSFGGSQDKAATLCQQQQLGIQRLLQDNRGTVLAHSRLQQRILEDAGLNANRFKYLHPPIGVPPCNDPKLLPTAMQHFIHGADLILLTAVARLDYFKNVELTIQAGLELLKAGTSVKVLVVGDPEADSTRRRALLEPVPADKHAHFMVLPRLAKDQLYALFRAVRRTGVFLCTSRYETLGITPLEAAAAGVVTLVTETPNVEALTFMPATCRVPQDAAAIAAKVQVICRDGGIPAWSEMVKRHVRPATSLEGFREDLLAAWAGMSGANTRDAAGPETVSRSDQSLQDSDGKRRKCCC